MTSQPKCHNGCRMVPVLPELWLCDHASYGRMSYLKGCVEEAREMMSRFGGYQRMRDDLDRQAQRRKEQREQKRLDGVECSKALMRRG